MTYGYSAQQRSDSGNDWPGATFGATAAGVGAVASMGRRMGAFMTDIAFAAVAAWVFTWPSPPENWSLLVWAAMTIVTVALFGITPGGAVFGIRVASVSGALLVGLWAVPRTVLIFLIIPPLLANADGRGVHDRLCRTIVLRTR